AEIDHAAAADGISLYDAGVSGRAVRATLARDRNSSLPQQVGRAVRPVANNAGTEAEEINIVPVRDSLRGPAVTLNRRDLEAAMAGHDGSPEEIWRDASFNRQDMPVGKGRYLAGDFGGTLGIAREAQNGVRVRGFVTATNKSDLGLFGGGTNVY